MMNSARWFRDWYAMVRRVLDPAGALWTCCNWRSLPVVMRAACDAEWSVTSTLVWNKDWIGPGGTVGLRPCYELVALLAMSEFQIPDRGERDIWTVPWSSNKPNGHPAEKPEALYARLISASGVIDGVVLDPFMGCGTSLAAAKRLGVGGVGVEIEERWCEVAAKRLEQEVLPMFEPAVKATTPDMFAVPAAPSAPAAAGEGER
jgi:site-specific DNA-methyltransferase (adenine-specific)